ncbi:MAG TPA: hypothetical protein VEH27_11920 [Methylomirabilota bacterium]|nr:hypothetical protein [Methylomirabilota bacterium]
MNKFSFLDKRHPGSTQCFRVIMLLVIGIFLMLMLATAAGCTNTGRHEQEVSGELQVKRAALGEESRAMTTAIVDSLQHAPKNPATDLAATFAKRDQQLEGLPLKRVDVEPLLNTNAAAWKALLVRFDMQDKLLAENAALEAERARLSKELEEMGRKYEEERNKKIHKRFWGWLVGTFGFVGAIAALCFCPALIPLVGQFIGWIVSKIPSLASMFGVVSKSAFDAVVKGVGATREVLKKKDPEKQKILDVNLAVQTDHNHKRLIEATRQKMEAEIQAAAAKQLAYA